MELFGLKEILKIVSFQTPAMGRNTSRLLRVLSNLVLNTSITLPIWYYNPSCLEHFQDGKGKNVKVCFSLRETLPSSFRTASW